MRMKLAAALAVALVMTTGCGPGTAANSAESVGSVPLTIASSGRTHRFKVEVARTPEEQQRGLMFRGRLAPDAGMIFPLDPPRFASFWMKNTPSPLDLIFIRADGSIARISPDAVPYSLTQIESGEPVAAVLEIAGGRAAELGISENDKVDWPR